MSSKRLTWGRVKRTRLPIPSALLFILASCAWFDSPELAAKDLFTALSEGNSDRALSRICESFVMVDLQSQQELQQVLQRLPEIIRLKRITLEKQSYQTLENDGKTARVKADLDLRVQIGILIVKKRLALNLTTRKEFDKWCISRDTLLKELVQSLVDISK